MRMTRPGRRTVAVAAVAAAMLTTVAVAHQASAASDQASAAANLQVRVVTANLDFRGADYVKKAWAVVGPNADIVFVQEAKFVVLRQVLGLHWVVRQDTSSEDRQGSAVVIRRSITKEVGSLELVKGVDGGHCPDGGILTRWIAKVPVQLSNGRWIRVASLHMPPPRCQTGPGGRYATMADNVVSFVRRTDRLTVLGADWNKIVDDDPNDIGQRTGLKPRGPDDGLRIDGFYVSQPITTCCLGKLARTGDNHHRPVKMTIGVPAP